MFLLIVKNNFNISNPSPYHRQLFYQLPVTSAGIRLPLFISFHTHSKTPTTSCKTCLTRSKTPTSSYKTCLTRSKTPTSCCKTCLTGGKTSTTSCKTCLTRGKTPTSSCKTYNRMGKTDVFSSFPPLARVFSEVGHSLPKPDRSSRPVRFNKCSYYLRVVAAFFVLSTC